MSDFAKSFLTLAGAVLLSLGAGERATASDVKPLKVFVLAGQSNMQGHAHVRTLEAMRWDSGSVPLLRALCESDGTPRVCDDVWISSLSTGGEKNGRLTVGFGADENKIGPELAFGLTMRAALGEPILIIKTAWGGKSLHTDFRSPSAGPYEFSEAQVARFAKDGKDLEAVRAEKREATGRAYHAMVDHVKMVLSDGSRVCPAYDAERGYELAGFVWFQGWNDMVDGDTYPDRGGPDGYREYSRLLSHLVRDVRRDLSAPKLPFVIGVMGVGGPVAEYLPEQKRYATIHQNFRDAMAAPADDPELRPIVAVRTERFWDRELTLLRARDAEVDRRVKALEAEQRLSGDEGNRARERLRAEEFSAEERALLEKGVSNAEYHYLGSAKILSRIGEAFARALTDSGAGR